MKYAIVIADGSADLPLPDLGGRTPLEAAEIPNIDRVAAEGFVGTVRTVPDGFSPGSDVAMMSIVGYAPGRYYTGRAPLEAASMGVALADGDWALRCNLVTIRDGRMVDYSAGHPQDDEATAICATLNEKLGSDKLRFYPGKGYRNLLVVRSRGRLDVQTTPPHDIAGQPVEEYLPRGGDAHFLTELMERSGEVLAGHDVNKRRAASGQAEATSIWLWGEGGATHFPPFRELYGRRAAVITAVDLVAGICALAGWERIVVPGATGYYDTDYGAKAAAAAGALESRDLVLVHVEAPDAASHNRDLANKIRAIENIDSKIVAPLASLKDTLELRLLVMADHYTLVSTGAHDGTPVPFAMCGAGIAAGRAAGFSEASASRGPSLERGSELMERFLGG